MRAVLCSDLHLTLTPPVARSAEPNWLNAQARPLRQLIDLAKKNNCIIVCAGDVFDRWNAPIELANWVKEIFRDAPPFYAIWGQHDIPYHRSQDLKRSAFWGLVEMGVLTPIYPDAPVNLGDLVLHGFPWGFPLAPPERSSYGRSSLHLAVVHAYCWREGCSYPGVSDDKHASSHAKKLEGFDAAVFGDNHKGFLTCLNPGKSQKKNLLNCGGFQRRKMDEIDYCPAIGTLHANGEIQQVFLDCSQDKWITREEVNATEWTASDFINEIQSLEGDSLDFREAVDRWLETHPISEGGRQLLLKSTAV